jgi:hypothetical protein
MHAHAFVATNYFTIYGTNRNGGCRNTIKEITDHYYLAMIFKEDNRRDTVKLSIEV